VPMTFALLAPFAIAVAAFLRHARAYIDAASNSIKFDIPHRVRAVYGSQLGVAGGDVPEIATAAADPNLPARLGPLPWSASSTSSWRPTAPAWRLRTAVVIAPRTSSVMWQQRHAAS
jgi:hypothetical protein